MTGQGFTICSLTLGITLHTHRAVVILTHLPGRDRERWREGEREGDRWRQEGRKERGKERKREVGRERDRGRQG